MAAAAGVLSAHAAATRPPTTRYVVTRSNLPAGHQLTARDLGTFAARLPTGSATVPSAQAARLVGRTTAVALRRLDLLRPADLVPRDERPRSGVVVPLDVEPARSPGAALRPGAIVTGLATDPDAVGTVTVVPAAEVVAVGEQDDTLG
ncbi:MAG: hypothetical protein ACKO04_00780, partial [Actinomycetes bacterium]